MKSTALSNFQKKKNILKTTIIFVFLATTFLQTNTIYSQVSSGTNVVFPTMTEKQRDGIFKPVEGMVIYNKEAKKPQYYDGSNWKFFDVSGHYIGELYGGGIIFYIDPSGDHGLICAPTDQSNSAEWGFFEKQRGANGYDVGTGKSNTEKIVANSDKETAASICYNLHLGGYDDWFLPSQEELILMHHNLKLKGIGDFIEDNYWSSTETDFNNAWEYHFGRAYPTEGNVSTPAFVRAVRAF